MNYFIYGSEAYLVKNNINQIIDAIPNSEVHQIDAGTKSFNIIKVLEMANRISFFQNQQIIIVSNCNFLKAKGKIEDREIKVLEEYLKHPTPTSAKPFADISFNHFSSFSNSHAQNTL